MVQTHNNPLFARVTQVYPHESEDDKYSTEVDVVTRDGERKLPKVPVVSHHNGHISVPQIDDQVVVEFLRGDSSLPYITDITYTDLSRPPLSRAGHWRHEFQRDRGSSLYLEAEQRDHTEGEPDTVRFAVKGDGLRNPTARIELDRSGRSPVIRLTRGKEEDNNTDMGLVLNFRTGEFKIGDGSQYGIESDGNGNFTWHANSVNFSTEGTTITFDDSGGGSGGG